MKPQTLDYVLAGRRGAAVASLVFVCLFPTSMSPVQEPASGERSSVVTAEDAERIASQWVGLEKLGVPAVAATADNIQQIQTDSSGESILLAGYRGETVWVVHIDSADIRPPLARERGIDTIPKRSFKVYVDITAERPLLVSSVSNDTVSLAADWPVDLLRNSYSWSVYDSIPPVTFAEALTAASACMPLVAEQIKASVIRRIDSQEKTAVVWMIATNNIPFCKVGEMNSLLSSPDSAHDTTSSAGHPAAPRTYYGTGICFVDAFTGKLLSFEYIQ